MTRRRAVEVPDDRCMTVFLVRPLHHFDVDDGIDRRRVR